MCLHYENSVPDYLDGFDTLAAMKILRGLGWSMIWSGVIILLFLGYQLVGTNVITARAQSVASEDLKQTFEEAAEILEVSGVTVPDIVGPGEVPEVPVLFPDITPVEDQAFARLVIPKAEVDDVVFEGVNRSTLKSGPGHMPWTALPGQPGNAVISGHRTTYGAPFFDLDLIEPGDEIRVQTALGWHVYEVRSSEIVGPTDVWVTDYRDGAWLTLTTCHPKWSAAQRLVVFAELVEGVNYPFVQTMDSNTPSNVDRPDSLPGEDV